MADAARRFLFLLGSTRHDGNSEQLARRAARALTPGDDQRWLRLMEYSLPPFVDTRHSTGYPALEGNPKLLSEATLAATDLVFVAPVYWYSVPWTIKLYLDHWSGWMRRPELDFKPAMAGRSLWAVVVDSDDDAARSTDPAVDTLRRTADYMGMRWRGALIGHANRPGEIEGDHAAMSAATTFFTAPIES